MKYQQVKVDYVYMLESSCVCLALAFSGWVFIRLVRAIFWLPGYLRSIDDTKYKKLEKHLEDKILPDLDNSDSSIPCLEDDRHDGLLNKKDK